MLTHIICLTKGNEYWSFGMVYAVTEHNIGSTCQVCAKTNDGVDFWIVPEDDPYDITYHEVHDHKISEAYAEAVEQGKLTWDDVPSERRSSDTKSLFETMEIKEATPPDPAEYDWETHAQHQEIEIEELKAELAATKAELAAANKSLWDSYAIAAISAVNVNFTEYGDGSVIQTPRTSLIAAFASDYATAMLKASKDMGDSHKWAGPSPDAMLAERDKEEVK